MLLTTILLAALPLLQSDTPDLLVLKDGEEIECRVLFENDESVVYTRKRKDVEVPRSEVQSVQSVERSLREFLDAYDALPDADAAGLLNLASFCESRELLAEARNLWIRVLTIAPGNEAAWNKLGGVYSERRGWRLKVRGRFYKIEDLRERISDWKNALELPTAHFLLKTDLPPERAVDLSIDVERAYLTFYDLLGDVLRLYPLAEVPEIHIYSDGDDYPSPPTRDQVAWFAPLANTLHVNGEVAKLAPHAAVTELTDVLLFNAFRRTVGKTGAVSPWARDGIAQAFGGAYRRDPGHASWDLSLPIQAHFTAHESAKEPLALKDILRASRRYADAGTTAQLYAAQSYTLTHFLIHGESGEMRAKFGEFLKSSFRGQGAATHFKKILGVDLEEFETRWNSYVSMVAGR